VSSSFDPLAPNDAELDAVDRELQALWGEPLPTPTDFAPDPVGLPAVQTPTQAAFDRHDPRAVLRAGWGYDDFRGIQREIIDSLPVSTTTSLPLLLLQMQLKGVIIENEMHAYRRAERN